MNKELLKDKLETMTDANVVTTLLMVMAWVGYVIYKNKFFLFVSSSLTILFTYFLIGIVITCIQLRKINKKDD